MFSSGLGGIEQSFLDYAVSMDKLGHKSTVIISPDSEIYTYFEEYPNIEVIFCKNNNQWDFVAKSNLHKILKKNKPDILIAHGNRAIRLLQKPSKHICPIVGVAHNYKLKQIDKCSAIFTITQDLKTIIIDKGFDSDKIYHIPNMIDLKNATTKNTFHKTPVIGTMGRFVNKKGFHVFIHALYLLHQNNIPFRAIIGGDGEDAEKLNNLALNYGIEHKIDFVGWINKKQKFFDEIDIFCLPSLHEPFGIVLLEAFSYAKPVISTNTEGPSEIATDNMDVVFVDPNSPEQIFHAIKKLLDDNNFAFTLGERGLQNVIKNYDKNVVAKKIEESLVDIINK